MSVRLHWAIDVAAVAALVSALLLGAFWLRDRMRRWEEPGWGNGSFALLRAETTAPGARASYGTWVAPVNPRCEHCLNMLRRMHTACAARASQPRLVALIVDTPARPPAAALRLIPPMAVWWDRGGIWRRRWGHRLYGELIEFDAAGRYVRTAAVSEFLNPAPLQSFAPVTRRGGP
jgi:hypothetical protein